MEDKYIIGIDGGTQSSKVVIFDSVGNIVCEARQPLKPLHMPAHGVAEHPDDDLWDSIMVAGNKAMALFPYDKSKIIGIGLCTIRCCLVLLKENGALANQAISWMDVRLSGKYQPDIPEVKYATTTTGYTTYRLTGEKKDTAANLENPIWPLDKDKWDWIEDEDEFESFGLEREMLFKLQLPGTILGHVTPEAAVATGFPEGLPVVATANDKAVEALGAGLSLNSNKGLISLGTYITSMVYGAENITNSTHYWSNPACVPYQYLYESSGIRRGMSTVSWIKDMVGDEVALKAEKLGISPEQYLDKKAKQIPAGCYGLMTVLDWLAVPWAPYKRGVIIGFEGRHTKASHIYRSILEGIAMTMKNKMLAMTEELRLTLNEIVISGGGSNSDVFMQIFADVFGIPAVRNKVNSAASMGSAISAAVALNIYESHESAIKTMVKVKDVFKPNPENHTLYSRVNEEVYKTITDYTDEILKKTQEIFKEN